MYNLNDKQAIFVVVPAYNEAACIEEVINELASHSYSIIVVDDGSVVPVNPSFRSSNLFVLRHVINLGQGAALQTGIEFALEKGAQFIVTFDADGQHNSLDIDALIEPLRSENYDIALGSRFLKNSNDVPIGRRWVLIGARYINYLFTGLLLTDAHNGLRAMKAEAAQKINITENRMAHATEILSQINLHRLRYKGVPVKVAYTKYSTMKGQSALDGFRIIFDLFLNKVFK